MAAASLSALEAMAAQVASFAEQTKQLVAKLASAVSTSRSPCAVPAKPAVSVPPAAEAVSSDSSDTSDAEACARAKKPAAASSTGASPAAKTQTLGKRKAPPSESSDSDSDSSEESTAAKPPALKHAKPDLKVEKPLSPNTAQTTSPTSATSPLTSGGARPSQGVPFRRVDPTKVTFANEALKDNSVKLRENDFALKAVLRVGGVQGRDYKKQKTKGKKSSYECGTLSMASRSVKFDD
eukprot:RCo036513